MVSIQRFVLYSNYFVLKIFDKEQCINVSNNCLFPLRHFQVLFYGKKLERVTCTKNATLFCQFPINSVRFVEDNPKSKPSSKEFGHFLKQWLTWLYVIIISRPHFRVNIHSIFAWMSRNSLLETGAMSEV